MTRLALAIFITLTAQHLHAQPLELTPTNPPDPRENDPRYQEAKQVVKAQSACFKREALSKSIAKVDLQTAAYAVVGRCAVETARYKALRARYFAGSMSRFEQWWSEQEANDLEFVKKLIAVIRTAK
jgi:hypothetical protein